ncbi:MAG: hypothetical protein WCG34_09720 [Leptolinea sp.]
MPPNFSMQSILDYHHSRVEVLEVELGKLIQSQKEITALLEELMDDQARLFQELKNFQTGDLDLQKIAQTRLNIKIVQENIEKQKALLALLEDAIEAKLLDLVEARQDEAVFDKLKEKEMDRFTEKQLAIEKILQDDIYISSAHRRKSYGVEEEVI